MLIPLIPSTKNQTFARDLMNDSRLRNERYDNKLQPIPAREYENNLIT